MERTRMLELHRVWKGRYVNAVMNDGRQLIGRLRMSNRRLYIGDQHLKAALTRSLELAEKG